MKLGNRPTDRVARPHILQQHGHSEGVAGRDAEANGLQPGSSSDLVGDFHVGALPAGQLTAVEAATDAVEPSDVDIDARMAKIKEVLAFAGMPLLDRCSLIAEWVHHAEVKISVSGQVVQKPQGGRPEGGVAKASRELCVPGETEEARRKFVERAIKINALWDESKEVARAAGLDDTQSALLAIAGEHSLKAQLDKVREIAARKAAPHRQSKSSHRQR